MKEIPTTSGNYSVHGTDTDFIYKFFHSATVVSAFFEKKQQHYLHRLSPRLLHWLILTY